LALKIFYFHLSWRYSYSTQFKKLHAGH